MRQFNWTLLVAVVLVSAAMACGALKSEEATTTTPPPKTESGKALSISVADFSFTPSTVPVGPGQTVTVVFKNNGKVAHNIEGETNGPNFTSGVMNPGGSYTNTFTFPKDTGGAFSFWCNIHQSMQGNFVVR